MRVSPLIQSKCGSFHTLLCLHLLLLLRRFRLRLSICPSSTFIDICNSCCCCWWCCFICSEKEASFLLTHASCTGTHIHTHPHKAITIHPSKWDLLSSMSVCMVYCRCMVVVLSSCFSNRDGKHTKFWVLPAKHGAQRKLPFFSLSFSLSLVGISLPTLPKCFAYLCLSCMYTKAWEKNTITTMPETRGECQEC